MHQVDQPILTDYTIGTLIKMAISDDLTGLLTDEGAALVGFADMQPVPVTTRDNLPFAVSFAVALDPGIISGLGAGPTRQYYQEYSKANDLLKEMLEKAALFLRQNSYRAVAVVPTIVDSSQATHSGISYDPATLSASLPHKTAAVLAGLGWIGRCDLLVTEAYGSAVRLATVLTDAGLPVGAPLDDGKCDRCTACVDSCPARAVYGREWQPGISRDLLEMCSPAAKRPTV